MSRPSGINRRKFLTKSARQIGAAGFAATSLGWLGAPAPARVLGANERIRLGVIGSGDRARYLIRYALDEGKDQVEVVALCDVATFRLDRANADLVERGQPKADTCRDHRELLGRPDIDAVIIAGPDHWHHDHLIDSLDADKDVFIEKPLSYNIKQGRSMVSAVGKTDRIVQVGNHRRSGEHWRQARDLIQEGSLGDINWVRVYDTRNWTRRDPFAPPEDFSSADQIDWDRFQGPAPRRPFDPHRYFAWRWFWDYAGGLMTDIGAHWLDVAQWLTDHDEGPRSVVAHGGNYRFGYWETPDVVHAILDYGNLNVVFDVSFTSGNQVGDGGEIYGTDGVLIIGRREMKLYKEFDTEGQPVWESDPVMTIPMQYEGPAHMANWLQCLRSRQQPNSPIHIGHQVITAAHLANEAYKTGRRIRWDPHHELILEES